MLAAMTSLQVTEWRAYYDLEHLGEHPNERADLRAGIIAATIANVLRGKGGKTVAPADLMPKFEEPTQSVEALYAALNRRADADAAREARRKAASDGRAVPPKARRGARTRQ